jgi:hypothetical protein
VRKGRAGASALRWLWFGEAVQGVVCVLSSRKGWYYGRPRAKTNTTVIAVFRGEGAPPCQQTLPAASPHPCLSGRAQPWNQHLHACSSCSAGYGRRTCQPWPHPLFPSPGSRVHQASWLTSRPQEQCVPDRLPQHCPGCAFSL